MPVNEKTRGMSLSYNDRMHLLDALEDALTELDENELVPQALMDKLQSAREIVSE